MSLIEVSGSLRSRTLLSLSLEASWASVALFSLFLAYLINDSFAMAAAAPQEVMTLLSGAAVGPCGLIGPVGKATSHRSVYMFPLPFRVRRTEPQDPSPRWRPRHQDANLLPPTPA